jgi:hypothetical protein
MASEHYEFRIPLKRLLIGLLLTVVPISIAGLWSISQSERSLERTIGSHFKTIEISQFIQDRVIDVVVMAHDPAVVDAIRSANRSYQGMSESAVSAKVQRIEKLWNTPSAAPIVSEMLASRASQMIRRHHERDPRFLRITVTDERGAAIAATHKTLDYFQADEDFWQAIYASGRGAVNVTDILYDEVTKSHYIGIGVPVLEEGSNRFTGTVDALVDVSTLFPFVNRVQIGPTARASLVKDDSTIVGAPNITYSMKMTSNVFTAVKDAMQTLEGRQTGYIVADVKGEARKLIGFADTGLREDYRNLDWVVLVSQDTQEAFRPIRTIGRLLAFMALIGLATVMFLGVYFSIHWKEEMAEIEELHHPTENVSG